VQLFQTGQFDYDMQQYNAFFKPEIVNLNQIYDMNVGNQISVHGIVIDVSMNISINILLHLLQSSCIYKLSHECFIQVNNENDSSIMLFISSPTTTARVVRLHTAHHWPNPQRWTHAGPRHRQARHGNQRPLSVA